MTEMSRTIVCADCQKYDSCSYAKKPLGEDLDKCIKK